MKRLLTLPLLALVLTFLLVSKIACAQNFFTTEVKGKGKPVILIHGLYCNGEVWKETVEHYQQNYECHILTLAGFGGNAPNLNDTFLRSVKDDIIAYAKNKKLKAPIIVGHSMGGFLSLWAAATEPTLFNKVIVVDGLPFMAAAHTPGATEESAKPMAENMRTMMSNQTAEQVVQSQKQILSSMITDAHRIEHVAAIAAKADSKTQGQVMYEMFTTDLRTIIASIESPVLVLGSWIAYKNFGATHDSTLKMFSTQMASVKNCKIELSDTSKHFIFYDDPTWFFTMVDDFLIP
jgi:pimeloyl-ACP methyl ester carboxylesterase